MNLEKKMLLALVLTKIFRQGDSINESFYVWLLILLNNVFCVVMK